MKTREKLHRLIDVLEEQKILAKDGSEGIGWFSHDKHIPRPMFGSTIQNQIDVLNKRMDYLINYLDIEFKETSTAGFVKKSVHEK